MIQPCWIELVDGCFEVTSAVIRGSKRRNGPMLSKKDFAHPSAQD